MAVFRVLLEGRNLRIKLDEQLQLVGFYTTRYIDATDALDARERAIGGMWAELRDKTVGPPRSDAVITVETCEALDDDEEPPAVRPGLAWFPEERTP